jgi:hypothetical protein
MTKNEALQELCMLKMLRKEANGNVDEIKVFATLYDQLFSVIKMKATNDLLLSRRILEVNDVCYKIQHDVVVGSDITIIQFMAARKNGNRLLGMKFIDGKYTGHAIIKESAISVPGKPELEYTDIGYKYLITLYEGVTI